MLNLVVRKVIAKL